MSTYANQLRMWSSVIIGGVHQQLANAPAGLVSDREWLTGGDPDTEADYLASAVDGALLASFRDIINDLDALSPTSIVVLFDRNTDRYITDGPDAWDGPTNAIAREAKLLESLRVMRMPSGVAGLLDAADTPLWDGTDIYRRLTSFHVLSTFSVSTDTDGSEFIDWIEAEALVAAAVDDTKPCVVVIPVLEQDDDSQMDGTKLAAILDACDVHANIVGVIFDGRWESGAWTHVAAIEARTDALPLWYPLPIFDGRETVLSVRHEEGANGTGIGLTMTVDPILIDVGHRGTFQSAAARTFMQESARRIHGGGSLFRVLELSSFGFLASLRAYYPLDDRGGIGRVLGGTTPNNLTPTPNTLRYGQAPHPDHVCPVAPDSVVATLTGGTGGDYSAGPWMVCGWCKPSALEGVIASQRTGSTNGHWQLGYVSGELVMSVETTGSPITATIAEPPAVDRWMYVACGVDATGKAWVLATDGSELPVWADDRIVSSGNWTPDVVILPSLTLFNRSGGDASTNLAGSLANVAVFNTTGLSNAQHTEIITQAMTGGLLNYGRDDYALMLEAQQSGGGAGGESRLRRITDRLQRLQRA